MQAAGAECLEVYWALGQTFEDAGRHPPVGNEG